MRDDVPPRYSPPPGADDVGLTDVTDQGADLPGRHPTTVSVHNRRVPDETDYVVLGSSPSVLLLSLDQPLAEHRQLAAHPIACRVAHVCQYDIPSGVLASKQPSPSPLGSPQTSSPGVGSGTPLKDLVLRADCPH